MNLFSMFDPSSSTISMNWMALMLPMIMMIQNKNTLKMKITSMLNMFLSEISKEIKPLMSKTMKKGMELSMLMIFFIILISNMMALMPFIFTPTAHMMLSFPMALTFWVSFMLYGWMNNSKNMMAHSVPTGTPLILMNFMVMIELVSNIIRPLTLAIRLSANMVAGHLLLSLLSNFSLMSTMNMTIMSPMLMILSSLEVGVALIQAYVFMTLITLYSTEIH